MSIGNAFLKIFPNTNIKYYYCHYGRALEINKYKYCKLEVEEDSELHILITAW